MVHPVSSRAAAAVALAAMVALTSAPRARARPEAASAALQMGWPRAPPPPRALTPLARRTRAAGFCDTAAARASLRERAAPAPAAERAAGAAPPRPVARSLREAQAGFDGRFGPSGRWGSGPMMAGGPMYMPYRTVDTSSYYSAVSGHPRYASPYNAWEQEPRVVLESGRWDANSFLAPQFGH